MEDLITLISNLGFPIAVCCYLFFRMTKSDEQHKEEMDKMTDALNNNTLVIQRLVDKIGEDMQLEAK